MVMLNDFFHDNNVRIIVKVSPPSGYTNEANEESDDGEADN